MVLCPWGLHFNQTFVHLFYSWHAHHVRFDARKNCTVSIVLQMHTQKLYTRLIAHCVMNALHFKSYTPVLYLAHTPATDLMPETL
jgi:hypothetical protein